MHPRIALLVQTISKAIDDLFHFLLLFVVIYLTFCLIGVTTFGQKLQDYSSYGRCFGRLMDLMIDKPDFPTDYVDNGPIFLVRGGGPCEHRIPCDLSGSQTYVTSPPPPVMRSLCVPACLVCIGPSSYPFGLHVAMYRLLHCCGCAHSTMVAMVRGPTTTVHYWRCEPSPDADAPPGSNFVAVTDICLHLVLRRLVVRRLQSLTLLLSFCPFRRSERERCTF